MNEWITDHTPPVEKDVLVRCERNGYKFVTKGFYEDGTKLEEDSNYFWPCLSDYDAEYDDEHDQYFIPQNWWESPCFNDSDYGGGVIDCQVTGWMPLPEV